MATIFIRFRFQATALSVGAVAQAQLIIILELLFPLILSSVVLAGAPRAAQEWTAITSMTAGAVRLLYMLGHGLHRSAHTAWSRVPR